MKLTKINKEDIIYLNSVLKKDKYAIAEYYKTTTEIIEMYLLRYDIYLEKVTKTPTLLDADAYVKQDKIIEILYEWLHKNIGMGKKEIENFLSLTEEQKINAIPKNIKKPKIRVPLFTVK